LGRPRNELQGVVDEHGNSTAKIKEAVDVWQSRKDKSRDQHFC
jgi:hypothetical protein